METTKTKTERDKEAQRRYYLKHREEKLKRCKEYRESDVYKEKVVVWRKTSDDKRKYDPDRIEWRRKTRHTENYKNVEKAYLKSCKGKYSSYKKNAATRKLEFNLSFDEFVSFWKTPCGYCGSEIDTIGLDRLDNLKGYDVDNVIPCCKICNFMKCKLTKEEFITHITKIYNKSLCE